MTEIEIYKAIVQKQDEYIFTLENHMLRYDLNNPVHVRQKTELVSLRQQLAGSETHIIDEMDNSPYEIVFNGRTYTRK